MIQIINLKYLAHIKNTIHQLMGGVRSSMGYCGCETVKEFGEKTTMVQVTGAALKENHPHEETYSIKRKPQKITA